MKTIIKERNIWSLLLCAVLLVQCSIEEPINPGGGVGPDMVKVKLEFYSSESPVISTKANDALMNYIDNVHILIFNNGRDGVANTDDDEITYRDYLGYGVEQMIYLKTQFEYRIFVVANLDASNLNVGNAATFFNDVETLGALRAKHIMASSRSVEQLGKMVMTTDGPLDITLPTLDGSTEILLKIPLSRVNTKIIYNVFNKVTSLSDKTVTSGVYPTSWNVINVPKSSFLVMRPVQTDGKHDYPFAVGPNGDIANEFIQSQAEPMPPVENEVIEYKENYYTKQTFYFYTFENRRGDVSGLTDAKQRNGMSPDYATFVQILGNTTDRAIVHYIHPGKGRESEPNDPDHDLINNFDIDRSCIYHMNVYINGKDEVLVDTRRQYLNQHVTITFPDLSRIDGHYVDIPAYIIGMNGYVKLQSATCSVDANGNILTDVNGVPQNMVLMDTYPPTNDEDRWLRFSLHDPYYAPESNNTKFYLSLNSGGIDAMSGATAIFHFNEYLNAENSTIPGDPKKRTAVTRVGYVPGAENDAEYEDGVARGMENVMYLSVSQYGINTVGVVGGFDGISYTKLLGVESVEESRFQRYNYASADMDIANIGPFWQYRPLPAALVNFNQPFDGKRATTDHYNNYRYLFAGGIPPKREQAASPAFYETSYGNRYAPSHNTNAADYCMRKNRDENGDGVISGAEIKWYLPTPVQMMQIDAWRDYQVYSFDAVGPASFASPYWTTNESDAGNAIAFDMTNSAAGYSQTATFLKTSRRAVRCVRDMPGATPSAIYMSGDYVAIDLNGIFPPSMLVSDRNAGQNYNLARDNQQLQSTFIVSRWYTTSGNDHNGIPAYINGNRTPNCSSYSEPGTYGGLWSIPTQREMAFIYAYSGQITALMETHFGGNVTNGNMNYHSFVTTAGSSNHWAATDIGNSANYWSINFNTGASAVIKKTDTQGYFRCVRYVPSPLPRL